MRGNEQQLDNPVWHSLAENHRNFAIEYDGMKFYHPDYCPFGGFIDLHKTMNGCNQYSALTNNFYIVGDKPHFSTHLKINKELVCNQMLLRTPFSVKSSEKIIALKANHKNDLLDLINLVQPGYFRAETIQLGSYYGIYKNSRLIAATGERMKMANYTEISAVVTHPEHTGMGYAKQLIAHTCSKIFSEHKTPYLHVAENNTAAISLYEKLGFLTRRKISFWNLMKPS